MSSGSEPDYDDDPQEIEVESENIYQQSNLDHSPEVQHMQEEPTRKLVIQQDETDKSCATYVFLDEDHTLGNMLRYTLINRPDVEFCGYSLPHPSENKMNLRLQTIRSTTTEKVLNNGLETIIKMCEILRTKFENAE